MSKGGPEASSLTRVWARVVAEDMESSGRIRYKAARGLGGASPGTRAGS